MGSLAVGGALALIEKRASRGGRSRRVHGRERGDAGSQCRGGEERLEELHDGGSWLVGYCRQLKLIGAALG